MAEFLEAAIQIQGSATNSFELYVIFAKY